MYAKRKNYRRKVNRPYKRKYTKKGKTSITKIVNNVINRRLEKKRFDVLYSATDGTMGQCSGNGNAFYTGDITPAPAQGANQGQRIGNDVKITSMYMTLQLRQQSQAVAPVKCQFYIMRMKGDYSSTSTQLVQNSFIPNEYVGGGTTIYDTQSAFNPDFFSSFTILKRFRAYIKPDQITGQQMPTVLNIGAKFKKPLDLRFYGTSGTATSAGKIFIVGFASNGNASPATASTLANVAVTQAQTGQFINFAIKWYYNDA